MCPFFIVVVVVAFIFVVVGDEDDEDDKKTQEEQGFVFATLTRGKISSLGAEATNLLREDFQGMPMEGVHPRKEMSFSILRSNATF